jgi:hypothetical protein
MVKRKPVIYVSFYTIGEGNSPDYTPYVKRLRQTLDKFKLKHDLVPVARKSVWHENVRYKPTFMREMLEKHKDDASAIVWVDADAQVRELPIKFRSLKEDIGAHFLFWPNKKHRELLSGTVYLANNPKVRKLMDSWITCCDAPAAENVLKPEQMILQWLLTKWGAFKDHSYMLKNEKWMKEMPSVPSVKVSVAKLPGGYCQIENFSRNKSEPIVILHGQASRLFRYSDDGLPRAKPRPKYQARRRKRKLRRMKTPEATLKEKQKIKKLTPREKRRLRQLLEENRMNRAELRKQNRIKKGLITRKARRRLRGQR